MRMDKGKPFMHIMADDESAPTFSESFLYDTVGKGDARFILGVAEEYEHVIAALGPAGVRAILDVRPQLAQRLGLGKEVEAWLEDARSEDAVWRERDLPSQVILDEDGAHAVWEILHEAYCTYFDPEESMPADALRTYNTLTDALGYWTQGQRQKERDKLPEKKERQKERKTQLERRREQRIKMLDAKEALEKVRDGEGDKDEALRLASEALGVAA